VLSELRVSQLGVIEDLSLVLGPGMTALTGETGAGKTLVVEAVELLTGGRADPMLVRPGMSEAVVEARFVSLAAGAGAPHQEEVGSDAGSGVEGGVESGAMDGFAGGPISEVVVTRTVPADGRSRAYIDGRMASVSSLADLGGRLVDLHGQHAHQSLLSPTAQRNALDLYAGAARQPRDSARARLRQVERELADVGGAAAGREREIELLRYQLGELDAASLTGPDEDDRLAIEEETLARAAAHRVAARSAYEGLAGEYQVLDRLGIVIAELSGHAPLERLHDRLRGMVAELADAASEAREAAETIEEDPQRLAELGERRAHLRELCRKYAGQGGGLEAVMAWRAEAWRRLHELEDQGSSISRLIADRESALVELRRASRELGDQRRRSASALGEAVQMKLRQLAMPRARFEVRVGGSETGLGEDLGEIAGSGEGEGLGEITRGWEGPGPGRGAGRGADYGAGSAASPGADLGAASGEDVAFMFAAGPGEPLLPLAKVASGGELARTMLALRLVLLAGGEEPGDKDGPATLVFDEVDAGIGGQAALAVGRALAELASRYQVIVVTHLAQVAAFANAQIAVSKSERDGRSVATAKPVQGHDRVVELSRMLSGQPDSEAARHHALELLQSAQVEPGRERVF